MNPEDTERICWFNLEALTLTLVPEALSQSPLSCYPAIPFPLHKRGHTIIQMEDEDIERIRERLRKMSDLELRQYGRAARDLANPKKNGKLLAYAPR